MDRVVIKTSHEKWLYQLREIDGEQFIFDHTIGHRFGIDKCN